MYNSSQNKLALVTGATRGIGAKIATDLLNSGFSVIGIYKESEKLASKLSQKNSALTFYKCDLSSNDEIDKLIKKLSQNKFDLLVNNAGIIHFEKFGKITSERFDEVMNVNLKAPLLLSQGLYLNKNASIINITSTDAFIGSQASLSYSASKAALINLTKSLALCLQAKKIRVNAIAPNWVETEMNKVNEVMQLSEKLTPLKRNTSTEDISNLVIFLASDAANFINGTTITLDGGYKAMDYLIEKESKSLEI